MSCRSCDSSSIKGKSQEKPSWFSTVDTWVSSERCVDLFIGRSLQGSYHNNCCLHPDKKGQESHWHQKVVIRLYLEEEERRLGAFLQDHFSNKHKLVACNCGKLLTDQMIDSLNVGRRHCRLKEREKNQWEIVQRFVD
jgi:hypothetical protein